ncbi:MAG: hypothetical protein F4W92_10330 [Gammaproteobacteria bacterium]|nr:hypothetical protein [Gammaproteobacteria bacterium]
MKKSLGILLLLVTSGFVIGGGGTYLVHLATSSNDSNTSTVPGAVLGSQDTEEITTPSAEADSSRDPISTSNIQSVSKIDDPSLEKDSFQRKLVVYSFVAGLSEQQVAKELLRSVDHELELSRSVLVELQTALIEKLATLNPTSAMTFVAEQRNLGRDFVALNSWGVRLYDTLGTTSSSMPFVQRVFKEWALNDRDGAIKNAKSLREDVKHEALDGILASLTDEPLSTYRNIAKELGDEEQGLDFYVRSFNSKRVDDPKTIWNELATIIKPNDSNHLVALGAVTQQWFQKDGISVIDQVRASALNEDVKNSLQSGLLRSAAMETPYQAFQYALNLPIQGFAGMYSQPESTVVLVWAESDPQAAYQAATSIEQSGRRDSLQRQVVSVWAANEPYYFLENLDSFPPQMRDLGSSSALQAIAVTSPQEAAEIALEQIEGGFGGLSYVPTYILRHWVDQDTEAAIQWVLNGPMSEENRYSWVSALATNLVNTDPRRAFDIALQQPIPERMGGMYTPALEAQILGQIVYQDFDLAVELLPKVREGSSRPQAYTSVGSQYINLGQSSKAVDLGLKLTANEQTQYFQSIAYTWASIDASGLVESFKNLPTAEIRSNLARTLTSQWMKDNFTEAQLEVLESYSSDSD